jgi:hypothetical protein
LLRRLSCGEAEPLPLPISRCCERPACFFRCALRDLLSHCFVYVVVNLRRDVSR